MRLSRVSAGRCLAGALALAWVLAAGGPEARAQDIEPRAYSNAPVGVNFLILGYAYTEGGVAFDTALPIDNPELETHSGFLAYARVLDLWGMSGKIDAVLPYTWLDGSAELRGETITRNVDGFGDPRVRLTVNFHGAPALTLEEFQDYRQDLIVGASLQVSVPTGQYDADKLVNIGTNRWFFKPEIGVSKAWDPWILELSAAATFFTDNDDFFGGRTREQDPLYSFQAHAIYSFPLGIWASVDGTFFTGGRTTIDGVESDDRQENWRVGGTLALPVNRYTSIKFYASRGVSSRTGNDYDLAGLAWQVRWGGGL